MIAVLISMAPAAAAPRRIVSLNLCTDELLLLLAPRERIASISYLSQRPEGAPPGMEKLAMSFPVNHGLAEEVLLHQPDLVVAGAYAARPAVAILRKLGYRVVDFSPEENFDDMRRNIRLMGALVGEPARAETVIAAFEQRLAEIQKKMGPERPVYANIGVNNWMAGKNTLPAAVTNAAGYRTLGEAIGFEGYRNLPMERLLLAKPDLMTRLTPFANPPSMATQGLNHPALRKLAAKTEQVAIPERYWVCAAPSSLRAVQMLAEKRAAVGAR
jgi:iron complex transport system substrate-binding protein